MADDREEEDDRTIVGSLDNLVRAQELAELQRQHREKKRAEQGRESARVQMVERAKKNSPRSQEVAPKKSSPPAPIKLTDDADDDTEDEQTMGANILHILQAQRLNEAAGRQVVARINTPAVSPSVIVDTSDPTRIVPMPTVKATQKALESSGEHVVVLIESATPTAPLPTTTPVTIPAFPVSSGDTDTDRERMRSDIRSLVCFLLGIIIGGLAVWYSVPVCR